MSRQVLVSSRRWRRVGRRATLTLDVEGPGAVVVTGDVEQKCLVSCVVEAPEGSSVTVTAVPRAGGRLDGVTMPCANDGPCTLELQGAASASAKFVWIPLPPVTRYAWRQIEGRFTLFTGMDSRGNAIGASFEDGPFRPVRYDAALDRVSRLPGVPDGLPMHVNDDGVIVLGRSWRYENGVATRIVDPEGAALDGWDLSERGWIVGRRSSDSHEYEPWVHDGTTGKAWGNVADPTVASAVNTAGQVVGSRSVHETFPAGKAWVGYSVQIRPDSTELLAIGEPSHAYDLSDTGLVVGSLSSLGPRARGYVYDLGTGALEVLNPIGDDIAVFLKRINPSGTVAIGSRMLADRSSGAAVYFVNERRLVALDTMVDLPAGCWFEQAIDVNVFGQVLALMRCIELPNGGYVAYLLLTPE